MILKIMDKQRNHKVHSGYGTSDYFKYYKINGGVVDSSTFSTILRELNNAIADEILNGYIFRMPHRMGALSVTKKKEFIDFKNGRAVTNRPIDFKATLEMWSEDPETKEQKKLVRFLNKHTDGYIYKIAYNRYYATFRNKSVYSCQINRYVKRSLAKKIFSGFELDALVEKPKYSK